MQTHHKIIIGDARDMKEVADESVHLIITSPPYWQLKDYGTKSQIGFNSSYEEYINHLNIVWSECYRILHKGCRLCINIGDQFARAVYYGRYKIVPIHAEIIKFCEQAGFDYMGAIIWQKPTTMNTTGGASVMGSYPYPRNGIIKIDFEYILLFKKPGDAPKVPDNIKRLSAMTKEEWNEYFSGHWQFNGERQQKHLAMFPEELPKRLIKMFSFVGDVVLDPFLGSGTTTKAARYLQRHSIGYEINPQFIDIIKEKVAVNSLISDASFEFIYQEHSSINWQDKIKTLPYQFYDPVKFDKKINPKLLTFGSKIDGETSNKERYYKVKSIVSPEIIELNDGLKIKLIGIKPKHDKVKDAIEFLNAKINNQRVFLKFDQQKYDSQGHLLCYLYLKNKTFINAHLLKHRLVEVDTDDNYALKEKFIQLTQ